MSNNDNSGMKINTTTTENADSVYGGSHYRLSYAQYENSFSPKARSRGLKPRALIIAAILFVFFVSLGFFIMKYYNEAVSDIYKRPDSTEKSSTTYREYAENDYE